MVVIPFENVSPTPGLEWLGESFPEAFLHQLNSPVQYVASRDERLRAYDRQGVPAGVHRLARHPLPSRQQMDVDYAVLVSYRYDGVSLTATAQLLDMRAQKLLARGHRIRAAGRSRQPAIRAGLGLAPPDSYGFLRA